MENDPSETQLERFLSILLAAFFLAIPVAVLSLGLGLLFLGFTKAIGLSIVTLLIAFGFFTRRIVNQERESLN